MCLLVSFSFLQTSFDVLGRQSLAHNPLVQALLLGGAHRSCPRVGAAAAACLACDLRAVLLALFAPPDPAEQAAHAKAIAAASKAAALPATEAAALSACALSRGPGPSGNGGNGGNVGNGGDGGEESGGGADSEGFRKSAELALLSPRPPAAATPPAAALGERGSEVAAGLGAVCCDGALVSLWRRCGRLAGYQQHDAHELFVALLHELGEDFAFGLAPCAEGGAGGAGGAGGTAKVRIGPLQRIFGGELVSTIECGR